jgi:hypothetical protein
MDSHPLCPHVSLPQIQTSIENIRKIAFVLNTNMNICSLPFYFKQYSAAIIYVASHCIRCYK